MVVLMRSSASPHPRTNQRVFTVAAILLGLAAGVTTPACGGGADEVIEFCIGPETPGGSDCVAREDIQARYQEITGGEGACKQFVEAESGPELDEQRGCCYMIAVETDDSDECQHEG